MSTRRKCRSNVQSDIWGDLFTAAPAEAHRTANLGWKTVIAVPNTLYFDVPYAPNPLERGYDWPTRGTDTFKVFSFLPANLPANASVMKDIKNKGVTTTDPVPLQPGRSYAGAQANLWSETLRRDSLVDYMLFPRLLAFAERAWHAAPWEPAYRPGAAYSYGDGKVDVAALKSDWNRFAVAMPRSSCGRSGGPASSIASRRRERASSRHARGQQRVSRPGDRISPEWRPVAPLRSARSPVSGRVELRTRSYDGRRTSRIVAVATS